MRPQDKLSSRAGTVPVTCPAIPLALYQALHKASVTGRLPCPSTSPGQEGRQPSTGCSPTGPPFWELAGTSGELELGL